MGNAESSSGGHERGRSKKRRGKKDEPRDVAARAKQVVGESVQNLQANISSQIKQLEEQDHPAAHFLDSVCGAYMDDRDVSRRGRSSSFYSEDYNSEEEDDDRTYSEDETTTTTDYNNNKRGRGRDRRRADDPSVGNETASYLESDYDSQDHRGRNGTNNKKGSSNKAGSTSFESEDSYSRNGGASEKSAAVSTVTEDISKSTAPTAGGSGSLPKPLASSFAKRCYFTKAGIGSSTQHYEGLTLTGNVVLMLAQAMKLKGCPTICDEDLRRVEQTYPNQFSRLPDELLLSSGWRRISKYCHFSNKPIPDGIPFFHSKQRLHPTGGYYFLLAAAVGMVRPIDVEPLTRDTLVLLETDYPSACDAAPKVLIEEPEQWTLVDKFCFFSGGPINTDEDVYYQADFDGNPIFMLAFLSPSLTPNELYKLDPAADGSGEPGLKSVMQVQEVESVYDLTDRDFDDLRLYHLGPCRALPQYILQPTAWTKVLPPHFLQARDTALQRAEEYELATTGTINMHGLGAGSPEKLPQHSLGVGAARQIPPNGNYHGMEPGMDPSMMQQQPLMMQQMPMQQPDMHAQYEGMPLQYGADGVLLQPMGMPPPEMMQHPHMPMQDGMALQQPYEHGPEDQMLPMDEAAESPDRQPNPRSNGMDPPDDEPPSLSKRGESGEEMPYFGGGEAPIPQQMQNHHNGFAYGDPMQQQHLHGYPNDASANYSNDPNVQASPAEYSQDQQQHFPGSEQYPEEPVHGMESMANPQYQGVDDRGMPFGGEVNGIERQSLPYQDEEHMQHENMHEPVEQRFPSTDVQRMPYDDGHQHQIDPNAMEQQQPNEQRYPSVEHQHMHIQEEQDPNVQHMQHELGQQHPGAEMQQMHYPNEQDPNHQYEENDQTYNSYKEQTVPHDSYQDVAQETTEDSEEYQQQETSEQYHDESQYYSDAKEEEYENDENNPISPQEQSLKFEYSADPSEVPPSGTDPISPASEAQSKSEYSHTSSAMRGARELLKRNRQKRLELAARRSQDHSETAPSETASPKDVPSPQSEVSGGTWESGSEVTSVVSATSSAWTENSDAPNRSSRRALILQMAKARMKNNNKGSGASAASATDHPELTGTYSITEEEKKLDGPLEDDHATDIDIAGDLD